MTSHPSTIVGYPRDKYIGKLEFYWYQLSLWRSSFPLFVFYIADVHTNETHTVANNIATSYNVNGHDMVELQESKVNVLSSW